MADREQSPTPKGGMDEKQQRDIAGKGGQGDLAKEGNLAKDRPRTGKSGGTVGRDVPEHSFAKDTETAVEAGQKGEHSDDKP